MTIGQQQTFDLSRASPSEVSLTSNMHDVKALAASMPVLAVAASRFGSATLCPLVQGFALLPLTDAVIQEIAAAFSATGIERPSIADMAPGVAALASELSEMGPVAFLSTEFFGGAGGQSAAVWNRASVALQLGDGDHYVIEWPNSPVSQALRAIGVEAATGQDEFDTVGLGTHRSTERWAAAHAAA